MCKSGTGTIILHLAGHAHLESGDRSIKNKTINNTLIGSTIYKPFCGTHPVLPISIAILDNLAEKELLLGSPNVDDGLLHLQPLLLRQA